MKSKKSGNQFFQGGPKNFINFLFVGLLLMCALVLLNILLSMRTSAYI